MRTKLVRNLKRGDKLSIRSDHYSAVVIVACVQETRRGYFTGKRMWEVIADYPWWWPIPITGNSTDRLTLVE